MKILTFNVVIVLMIFCLSNSLETFNKNKEMIENTNEKSKKINKLENSPSKSESKSKKELRSEEELKEKLDTLSKTDESFYYQNDKLIENIKKVEENSKKITTHHENQFIEKSHSTNPNTELNSSDASEMTEEIEGNGSDNFSNEFGSLSSALAEKNESENNQKKDKRKKINKKGAPKKNQMNKFIVENKNYLDDLKNYPKKVESFKKYLECNTKSDILYLHITNGDNISKNPNNINLKPIFVVLSTYSLNLQNGIDTSTLFKTIQIKKILRISQQEKLKQLFCFDLVIETKQFYREDDDTITLCAKNSKEKIDWINAFQKFKECQVSIQNVDHNERLIYDFSKINELLKNKNEKFTKSLLTPQKAVKSLYYDNTNPTLHKSDATKAEESKVNNIVKRIMETFESSRIKENQIKRDMANKLKEAKQFANDMTKRQSVLVNHLNNNIQKQRLNEIKLIDSKIKNQEMNLLKAVENKVKRMRTEDIKIVKDKMIKQIENQQNVAEKKAEVMMTIIADSRKFIPYSFCIDKRLFRFQDNSFIRESCKRLFGEFAVDKCSIKSNFCDMCCNHHIGVSHANKLFNCKKKCNGLINGVKNNGGD